jgi:hypothetical protein
MAELDADLARLEGGLAPRARSNPPIGPAARRWPQVAGWIVGVGLIGLAVGMAVPRLLGEDEVKPAPPVASPAVAVPPAPLPAPPPQLPATVHVTVTSEPPGAAVWWGPDKKGVTPAGVDVPRGEKDIELVLKLDGYEDAKVSVDATRDQAVPVSLTPKPAPVRSVRKIAPPRPARPEADPGPTSGGEIKPSPYAK